MSKSRAARSQYRVSKGGPNVLLAKRPQFGARLFGVAVRDPRPILGNNMPVISDEEVSRQILGVFERYRVGAHGFLKRNHFSDVRDGDFQRGINRAVLNKWIMLHRRDRYRYILTDEGYAVGRQIGLPEESERVSLVSGQTNLESAPLVANLSGDRSV